MNKQKLNKFLRLYGQILLASFIIVLSMNFLIFIFNADKFSYQLMSDDEERNNEIIYNLTGKQSITESVEGYTLISEEDYNNKLTKVNSLFYLGFICLLGMILFNPDTYSLIRRIKEK